jgi:hypothetical protein
MRAPRKSRTGVIPNIRSVALLGLAPSGPWQALDDGVAAHANSSFTELVQRLAADNLRFSEPIFEDWGLFASAGPWELCLGPLDDESGWKLFLQRSGNRAVEDNEATRQILALLDTHLRAIPAFGAVSWIKRED